jgi:hypothetical protein
MTVKDLRPVGCDPSMPSEVARIRDSTWRPRLGSFTGAALDHAQREQLTAIRDKFKHLCVRDNTRAVQLLPKWVVWCDRSAKDHLEGSNSLLGVGRILELVLTNPEDRLLLWEVCEFANYAWRNDLWRLIGSNRDLAMHPASYFDSLNAGAPNPHCVFSSAPRWHLITCLVHPARPPRLVLNVAPLSAMVGPQSSCMRRSVESSVC